MIDSIQYLRAVAALMVVWHHGIGQSHSTQALFQGEVGARGVDLFFVISGFIMGYITKDGASPWPFLQRRLLRIVPLYWLVTGAVVIIASAAPHLLRSTVLTPDHVIKSLLFIPHENPGHPGQLWPILVPGWTLNYELFFYTIFALSLATRRPRTVLFSLFGALLIFDAMGALPGVWAFYGRPIVFEFVAGVLISVVWARWGALPSVSAAFLVLLGAGLLADWPLVGAPLVVLGCLTIRWKSRWFKELGDASYSIYLTHLFTLGGLRIAANHFDIGPCFFMALALLASAAVGWVVYHLIERPLIASLQPKRLDGALPVQNRGT